MRDAPRGQRCRSALGPDQRVSRRGSTAEAKRHPQWDPVDVGVATIASILLDDRCESTVLPMKHGLTKVKDFPSSSAPPGATIPE